MSHDKKRVLVVGGGIGGLTVACALAQRGHEVHVFEKASEIREVGAGVMIAPNAMGLLNRLGMAEALASTSVALDQGEIGSWRGPTLANAPLDTLAARYGAACMVFYRPALLDVLLARFRALAKPDWVHLGAAYVSHREADGVIVAQFEGLEPIEADVLIGADGIHSSVRGQMVGDIALRYSGQTCFRGVTLGFSHPKMPVGLLRETQGPSARFGACHVDPERVYWWAAVDAPAGGPTGPCSEEWRARLRDEIYGDWAAPVKDLIEATPAQQIMRNDLYDLPALPTWHQGRAVLLGDAAHAMTPNLGQGACSAIEDAWVLASHLDKAADLKRAFTAYEAERYQRTRFLQVQSWRFGIIGQVSSPILCRLREWLIRLTPETVLTASYDRIYGWRPSDLGQLGAPSA